MKTSKAIVLLMTALALSATPALAQRGGGGGSRGGGGGSHSSGVSHSSSSSSSRSSSSSSRSYSSPSSSRSSSSSSRSYSSPSSSRSSSTPASVRSSSSSSRSTAAPSRSGVRSESARPTDRGGRPAGVGSPRSGAAPGGREAGTTASRSHGSAPAGVRGAGTPAGTRAGVGPGNSRSGASTGVRTNPEGSYARPGRPGGVMPPSHRPIHPAPYFHHPWHGYVVHCHPIFWDPLPPRPWYWPGFWHYCNSYWYDYHVTDVVVVHDYVQQTYNVDMVTYGISGDIMYAIVRDGGSTYLQVYDKDDHLLAEQKINRKYCNMVIDADNGGCWISKKHNKDALLFIWAEGQLLIYEAD